MVEDYNGPRESGIALSVHLCVCFPVLACTLSKNVTCQVCMFVLCLSLLLLYMYNMCV